MNRIDDLALIKKLFLVKIDNNEEGEIKSNSNGISNFEKIINKFGMESLVDLLLRPQDRNCRSCIIISCSQI